MAVARNVLIILALAAIVRFAPGGGDTAALVNAILFTLLNVVFVYFGVRFYRERRVDIYGLGDRGRLLLYGGLAAIVLALAATGRWLDSGAGTLVWIALLVGAIAALVTVFRQYREYG
jgi:hypothetical protein